MALRTLYQTLLDTDLTRLRVIAGQWDVPLTPGRRTDMAAELADAMANVDRVARVLGRLTPEQRAALDDLLRTEGRLPWAIFTRRWGEIRVVGPGRLEREELWRNPISPAEGLWYWGLLQRAFDDAAPPVEWAFIPDELRLYLPPPPPQAQPQPEPCAPPPVITPGSDALADTLADYFAALQVEPRRLQALPHHLFLETLAREQGWIDERKLNATAVLAWLRLSRWEQWERLIRAWMQSRLWRDLAHVPHLALDDPEADWPGDPIEQRRAVLDLLARCAPGAWYTLADFVAYVHTHAPDFLRPDGDYDRWPLRDAVTGATRRGFGYWHAVEGALLVSLITGPCAWLGLVDVGSNAPSQPPHAFRLSAAAEALLHQTPPPDLPAPPPVTIEATGRILIPAGARYARFQIGRIADPDPRGDAYHLTPSALRRAQKQRITPERILDFLREVSGAELPPALAEAIRRATTPGPAPRLETRLFLRITDEDLLRELQRHGLRGERIPQGYLFYPADRERLLTLLAQLGWLVDG